MSPDPVRDPRDPKSSGATSAPRDAYRVLQRLAFDVIDAEPNQDFADLLDALKTRAAQLHIRYDDPTLVGCALTSALFLRRHQHHATPVAGQARRARRTSP